MTSPITTIQLACGMTLLIERVPNVASCGLVWLAPAGSSTDPPDGDGLACLLSEMIMRGAGSRSSREFSDALDLLGLQRGTDVQTYHLRIEATMLGVRLSAALPLLVDLVRAPKLPAEHMDAVRSLALQGLEALNDDPQHLVMLRLREQHLPPPLNRHGHGERSVLEHVTIDQLREAWVDRVKPRGSILALAGAVDPAHVADQLNRLLDGWNGLFQESPITAKPRRGVTHLKQDTAQVHIGVAWDAPKEADPNSMVERIAIGALSGSTSGRLFTEVRQKRSLCYSVGASYRAGRDSGIVTLYSGTTPERAQETLNVCMQEIDRLRAGITAEEFHRAVIGLKAHQIMQGESTPSRASALVYDQFRLGRARTLDEVAAQIDAITLEQVNHYLAKRTFGQFSFSTIGPDPLQTPKR
jgi:predicted Zn-dependent peptidase